MLAPLPKCEGNTHQRKCIKLQFKVNRLEHQQFSIYINITQ
jgi:hypothetical protein